MWQLKLLQWLNRQHDCLVYAVASLHSHNFFRIIKKAVFLLLIRSAPKKPSGKTTVAWQSKTNSPNRPTITHNQVSETFSYVSYEYLTPNQVLGMLSSTFRLAEIAISLQLGWDGYLIILKTGEIYTIEIRPICKISKKNGTHTSGWNRMTQRKSSKAAAMVTVMGRCEAAYITVPSV